MSDPANTIRAALRAWLESVPPGAQCGVWYADAQIALKRLETDAGRCDALEKENASHLADQQALLELGAFIIDALAARCNVLENALREIAITAEGEGDADLAKYARAALAATDIGPVPGSTFLPPGAPEPPPGTLIGGVPPAGERQET